MPPTPQRQTFTVEQANRMLPLVSRIVHDVMAQHARWRQRVDELEALAARVTAVEPPEPPVAALEREVQELAREIDGFVRELSALGIELKDYETGLIDFPAVMGDRIVYLCWRHGEPAVAFWHEVHAGFAGRRPLAPRAPAGPPAASH